MEIDLKQPTEHPTVEELVIIFVKGSPKGELGTWDGTVWVDQNGEEQEIDGWAHFPTYQRPRKKRLLIMGCSATKDRSDGKMRALDRYTGVFYQTLKMVPGQQPDIVILSAEFGFIRDSERIPDYDRRMDKARAAELLPGASIKLGSLLPLPEYDEVFICAGKEYREVITPALKGVLGSTFKKVDYSRGGIGTQRQQLKAWLLAR